MQLKKGTETESHLPKFLFLTGKISYWIYSSQVFKIYRRHRNKIDSKEDPSYGLNSITAIILQVPL